MTTRMRASIAAIVTAATLVASAARAHCDSLDGPVIHDARLALEQVDAAPVLKWVAIEHEREIRDALRRTLAVRDLGAEAKQLADQYFFETVVRLHRASEGEGFTGLKAAGSVDPTIAAADQALQSGTATTLHARLEEAIGSALRQRFHTALERRKLADESVQAGREYVEAYVDYVHFVEAVHLLARQGAPHTHDGAPGDEE